MYSFTVAPQNLGQLYAKLGRALVQRHARRAQLEAADRSLRLLRERTRNAPPASRRGAKGAVASGRLLRGWRVRARGTAVTVENVVPYYVFVEKGRDPGAPPPSRALLPWVRRRLGLRGPAARRVAFLAARAIGKRGLRPRPILVGAKMRIQQFHREAMKRALDRAVREAARP